MEGEYMDLISIIVPVYKVEAYLDECVESIVHQSYKNLEIILVDDGSPDRCPAMCDAWSKKDPRIQVIHKTNGGLSDARNAGMSRATGQYVAFVDSDDWIEKNYIEWLYRAIQETASDLAACDVREVFTKEDVPVISDESGDVKKCTSLEALSDLLKGQGFRAVAWNKLYRAELLKDEHFEVGRLHEDEFFSYRIFDKAASLAYVDLPLYNYRQREGSIMSTASLGHLDSLDAYLGRLSLLKKKYPTLYTRDKVTFCITCLNFYCDTFMNPNDYSSMVRKKIKQYRKKIKFSMPEFLKHSPKNMVYIAGSSALLIDLFSKLRTRRGKK